MAKTWLVTGSSRGFGRELVTTILAAGDNVVATARRPEQLNDLVDAFGDRVRTVALDVTDAAAARAAVATAVDELGSLDVVVNNAGYANSVPIEEMDDEDFRQQIDANFFGVVNVTRAALPILREQRSGSFVQFSSVGGRVGGTPGLGAYQAAKFAVEGFSEVLAAEVKPFGVRVLIVEPGAFRTDWQGSSMQRRSVGPDYEATVGAMNRYREDTDGTQAGDPTRAARVIMDVVAAEDAPLRLLLGAGAVDLAEKSSRERAAEAQRWADVSRAADFPAGA
ncbi:MULTISPECIES: oxidoreductase [unclassified Rhodococcus (in: high G+C Gram-positive bacteria)]|uniref:oxidoreductase n=1 Tax=unclassified Rhodococcus (in: high G+C Gram-positive bacteria) TaxID=192944 RepID=UPI001639A867|nr:MULTISPECIES: oxidoreductase [unclassified Rhodococcus (in: high G+C Gram-positive bacteria)]MBC2638455.1 SDR family NAD(P)-dependent oxidoreductase [Rhodococcus sp. 3A]MBC2896804.1 SDR family NAD(P)-dependent oxidoreductase [Rhodococcus sp. 4CII]